MKIIYDGPHKIALEYQIMKQKGVLGKLPDIEKVLPIEAEHRIYELENGKTVSCITKFNLAAPDYHLWEILPEWSTDPMRGFTEDQMVRYLKEMEESGRTI
jgi:hypothetical protein